ncbi:zinc-binding dehydrogenase family protein [Anoxybacillus sp. B7M1]|uniref:zinc-dependent alcohol dehydrogenase family protein n=1 Tax=Anoxybacillaceae TaxID=3120669 RepID=UPI0005CCA9DF|nr:MULTISPECIES: zinc-dependent alcohol dehydrogenase family protein [Anoxybacillus]ANB57179.1 zinc-binding dehydrogenase family protein [Anoxybacillus sp. B2M1]ANB63408.1 zinc-binding dehydrogenase family protein [Anoxybacillus sp. B7M1]KXG08906.1 Phthiocerol synthesis polyketide synthase type I PpsC [Anoxybacillus sp. P3H1B]
MQARCIRFDEFGNPENVLKLENKPIHRPKNGEVLVRMKARPINPSDLLPIQGVYSHRISLPAIPGYEGVGIVEDVGPLVSRDWVGKRVLPLRGEGTWQEFVKTSAEFAVVIPHSINDVTAAQLYINPVTAWVICTEVLKLRPNEILLVNACGSSIGRIFAQLSKILGFRLIAVTRNDHHTKELLDLGASYVINTSNTLLYRTVMELTNGLGATAAVDSIGGADGTELAFCVRPEGVLLTIGLLSGTPVNWMKVSEKAKVHIKLFHLRHWNQQVSVQAWQETFDHLLELIHEKKLQLMTPAAYYSLGDIKEAIRAVEATPFNKGKIFLTSP